MPIIMGVPIYTNVEIDIIYTYIHSGEPFLRRQVNLIGASIMCSFTNSNQYQANDKEKLYGKWPVSLSGWGRAGLASINNKRVWWSLENGANPIASPSSYSCPTSLTAVLF